MNVLYSNILGKGKKNFIILHGFLGMGDNWKTHGKNLAEKGYCVHLIDSWTRPFVGFVKILPSTWKR